MNERDFIKKAKCHWFYRYYNVANMVGRNEKIGKMTYNYQQILPTIHPHGHQARPCIC